MSKVHPAEANGRGGLSPPPEWAVYDGGSDRPPRPPYTQAVLPPIQTVPAVISRPQIEYPVGDTVYYVREPIKITCQFCRAAVTTRTQTKAGRNAYKFCIIVACLGFFCGCCLYPLCVMRDIVHICPNCKRQVGYREHRV